MQKNNAKKILKIFVSINFVYFLIFSSCKNADQEVSHAQIKKTQAELADILATKQLDQVRQYAIINQMAGNLFSLNDHHGLILFLTDRVEKHQTDPYNSYWLLMTAYSYMKNNAEPVAEYYFDRILRDYPDLIVKGNSIHFICLQNLIKISKRPDSRILYFNELINRFPANVSITELYLRLAIEYEKVSRWDEALKAYSMFLAQPDASTIQITGEPNAYKKARQLVGFSTSPMDWTFESLHSLEEAVKKAIKNYDWRALDKYKAKVNFFSMSWKQDEMDPNAQEEFSMKNFMVGNRVRYSQTLDSDSNSNEAYLRTWGWSQYVSTWYLYFRKVNFPLDPDIHGNWEWAGIYMGEKL